MVSSHFEQRTPSTNLTSNRVKVELKNARIQYVAINCKASDFFYHFLLSLEAVIRISPWCDLSASSDSQSFNDGRDPTLTTQDSIMAVKLYAGKNDIAHPDISPINGDFDNHFSPVLITTGTRDLLLSLSVRLASILRKKGNDVDLQVWEDLWHVFEWDDSLPTYH